jgi:hypothetical protein
MSYLRRTLKWFIVFGRKAVPWILASIPLGYLIHWVNKYTVEVPYYDEWNFIPLWEKSFQGTLTFYDLWEPYCGHARIFFPKVITLVLVRISGWNIAYEIAVGILLAVGTFLLIVRQTNLTAKSLGTCGVRWIMPVISLILFSMSQQENWLWGNELTYYLAVFCVVASIVLILNPGLRWWRVLLALFLVFVAAHTSPHGLVFLAISWSALIFLPEIRRMKILVLIIWAIVSVAIIYSYFYGISNSTSYAVNILKSPLASIDFIFTFLGAPLFTYGYPIPGFLKKAALISGITGFSTVIFLSWFLVKVRRVKLYILVPYLSMALYTVGGAILTCMGRLDAWGSGVALHSRYITISSLLWITNVVLLYLLCVTTTSGLKSRKKIVFQRGLPVLVILVLTYLLLQNNLRGKSTALYRYYDLLKARQALILGKDIKAFKELGMGSNIGDERIYQINIIKKRHLSVFRER